MATVQKSTKLNFYKFVQVKEPSSTGSGVQQKDSNIAVAKSINTNTIALNNIGSVLNGIAGIAADLKKIAIMQLDSRKKPTFQPTYNKPQKVKMGGGVVSKVLSATGGFLEGILKMLGGLFKMAVVIPALQWLSDPKNQEKVKQILDVIVAVTKFIFDWAKFGITNTIDGLYNLLRDDASWWDRLVGFGQALAGIGAIVLGLRYLKNPTKIITDIVSGVRALVRFVTKNRGGGGGGLPNSRNNKNKNRRRRNFNPFSRRRRSLGGPVPERSQGGWIRGPQSGYKVSLDGGRSTSFIGHGTEYVARKSNGGAFVIPFNTPGTKVQPHLTQKRIGEAKSQGYKLPGFSQGGLVGGIPGKPRNPKGRKIFLHWSGGGHNSTSGLPYHQVFDGAGRPASTNVNYGVDKYEHTGGSNTDSIGLGAAAMGHGPPTKPYSDARGWRENPLTNAQTTAMAKEAAALMRAYGQTTADVNRNVWTHGEWERYAVKTGKLNPPVQRWDLDSLKPGPYNHPGGFFSTKQVKSKGGDQMRAKIKSFLGGSSSTDTSGSPATDPTESGGRSIFSNFLGAVDAMTGNRTDFDGMGSGSSSSSSSATTDTSSITETESAAKGKGYGYGALLDLIGKRESDSSGGYDAVNQVGTKGGHGVEGYSGPFSKMSQHGGKKLTSLTVKEVMALQSGWAGPMSNAEWIKKGKLHAVGRYQFIGPTLASLVSQGHAKPSDKFDESTQNKLAVALIKQVGTNPSRLKGTWIGLTHESDGAIRAAVSQGGDSTGGTNGGGISSMGGDSIGPGSSGGAGSEGKTENNISRVILGKKTNFTNDLLSQEYAQRSPTIGGEASERQRIQAQRTEQRQLQRSTDQRNAAREAITQKTREMVSAAMSQVAQSNGANQQMIQMATAQIQQLMAQGSQTPQPQFIPTGGGGGGGGRSSGGIGGAIGNAVGGIAAKTVAGALNSSNNPLRGIFR